MQPNQCVSHNVRVETDVFRLASVPFPPVLEKIIEFSLRSQRRTALAGDQTHRVTESRLIGIHERPHSHVHQTQVNGPAELQVGISPVPSHSTTVPPKLISEDDHRQLEAMILFVLNVELMGKIDIADRHNTQHPRVFAAGASARFGRGDRLVRKVDVH